MENFYCYQCSEVTAHDTDRVENKYDIYRCVKCGGIEDKQIIDVSRGHAEGTRDD